MGCCYAIVLPPDGTSGVASPVGTVIHSEDSKVVDDSAGKTSTYVCIYLGKHATVLLFICVQCMY